MKEVKILQMKSGKSSIYLGQGSLHYKLVTGFGSETCISNLSKEYWYYDEGVRYDTQTGILYLMSRFFVDEGCKVLSAKRDSIVDKSLLVNKIVYIYLGTGVHYTVEVY